MKTVESDYIIVGGGVIGLAIAYELACRDLRVTVLDRRRVGRQTSWAAAGILPAVPVGSEFVDEYERLRGLSYRLYPEWTQRLMTDSGIDVEYDRCGGLHIARGAGEAASLKAAASLWAMDGIQIEHIGNGDWNRIEPALLPAVESGRILSAVYTPDECVVRPPRLLKALVAACRRKNVTLVEDVEVESWQQANDRIESVTVSRPEAMRYTASQFCCATGAWSNKLTNAFSLDLEVQPWRGQMLLLAAPIGLIKQVINEGPNYLVPRRDGQILVGSTVEEVGFDLQTTDQAKEELNRFASEMIPSLGNATVVAHWAGLRPGTGDGWPLLGKAAERKNLYVATGHFRSGIFLAPATARVMTQLMCDESPEVDLKLFAVNRN
ncbi:MAG: glycine oxidase ThiO [Planctomycetota bacterium]